MPVIPLNKGKYAVVDNDIHAYLMQWSWAAKKQRNYYYAYRKATKSDGHTSTMIRMHREVLKFHGIPIPDGLVVDHINRNGLDNRIGNLNVVSVRQNALNAIRRNSKSGYIGVRWDSNEALWRAYIHVDGREKFVCYAADPHTAAMYRDRAVVKHYENATLNFPQYRGLYCKNPELTSLPEYELTEEDKRLLLEHNRIGNRNTSGYMGVHPSSYNPEKWVAEANVKGHRHYIGVFDSPEEAAFAREHYLEMLLQA